MHTEGVWVCFTVCMASCVWACEEEEDAAAMVTRAVYGEEQPVAGSHRKSYLFFFSSFHFHFSDIENDLQTRRLIALLFLLPDDTLIRRRKHTHFQDGNHHLHTLYWGIPAVWGTGKVSWNSFISLNQCDMFELAQDVIFNQSNAMITLKKHFTYQLMLRVLIV